MDVRTMMKYQHHDHLEPVPKPIEQRNLVRHNVTVLRGGSEEDT
jgi:hypothetical protein